MKNTLLTKYFKIGLFLLILGIVFILLENIFYDYVDSKGILQESLFLPLGAISIIVGGAIILFKVVEKTITAKGIKNKF